MDDMTKAEYARHRGVKPPYVSKLIRQGKIPVKPNGRIDAAEADFALDGARERAVVSEEPEAGFGGGGQGARLTQARTAVAAYDARIKQLQYEEAVGRLMPKAEVERAMADVAEHLAQAIDRLPGRANDLAAAFSDGGVKGLRGALKKVADELRRDLAENMSDVARAAQEDREAA